MSDTKAQILHDLLTEKDEDGKKCNNLLRIAELTAELASLQKSIDDAPEAGIFWNGHGAISLKNVTDGSTLDANKTYALVELKKEQVKK